MPSRLQLLHTWQRQLRTLVPDVRATRVANLALITVGLLWAGAVSLPVIAAALPLPACDASLERRLRRWLANTAVVVGEMWTPLLPHLLEGTAGQELVLVFDPTPQNDHATILVVGIVQHRRVLPVAWRVAPQQDGPWPERQNTYLRAMMTEVDQALPPDCVVTLLADRAITSAEVVDLCRALGWHYVLRVNTGPKQSHRVRGADMPERALWDLVTAPGQRWTGRVAVFKAAGWRTVELTIHWRRQADEPWVLISDRAAGSDRVREYRRRMRCEATYQDCKTRGFNMERSKLTDLARLDRLLLALHLALWWGMQLGLRVIRTGQRRRFDRTDRRDLSVLHLGRTVLRDDLERGRCPPLPFHQRGDQWRYAWLA